MQPHPPMLCLSVRPLDARFCACRGASTFNSLFYRSQHGASVGDMFTSFIHTAELHDQNPFEYLTAVLRHSALAALQPADWLPWTYKATLARLATAERRQ
jgi:hypothetical protein